MVKRHLVSGPIFWRVWEVSPYGEDGGGSGGVLKGEGGSKGEEKEEKEILATWWPEGEGRRFATYYLTRSAAHKRKLYNRPHVCKQIIHTTNPYLQSPTPDPKQRTLSIH